MSFKTSRGGSWFFGTVLCRAAVRAARHPNYHFRNVNCGFRLTARLESQLNVLRGGAWFNNCRSVRLPDRLRSNSAVRRSRHFGFRLAGRVSK